MVKNPSSQKKRAREPARGLTAQNKKDLECILGVCKHEVPGKSKCLYWDKVVDNDDPAKVQFDLIVKLLNKVLKDGGNK